MKNKKRIIILVIIGLALVGIAFGIKYFLFSGGSKVVVPEIEKPAWKLNAQITNPNYVSYVDKYSIIRDTDPLGGGASKYYSKYIEYSAPNGKPIRLLAQDKVTDSQILYSYSLLEFYLSNLSDNVANQMADNEAVLIIPNGTHGETKMSTSAMLGQELYQNEIANVGSLWYMESNYEYRDAAMEEIFHLVHDYGIGTSQNPQADNILSKSISNATNNALPTDKSAWGKAGLWGFDSTAWLEELEAEGSLEQEYFVSVLDSYYGLWEAWSEEDGGMWGVYIAKTRAQIKEKDPMGYEMISSFLPPYINNFMPVDESFTGAFDMNYDANNPYTFKSQYLKNLILQGDNNVNIIGNDQDNTFMGNGGVNEIDGSQGTNTLQLRGEFSQYTITDNENGTITIKDNISDRDGQLILKNIHILRFTDRDILKEDF